MPVAPKLDVTFALRAFLFAPDKGQEQAKLPLAPATSAGRANPAGYFIREHAGQTVAPNRIARRFVLSAGDREGAGVDERPLCTDRQVGCAGTARPCRATL